jgi:hypothetical protein
MNTQQYPTQDRWSDPRNTVWEKRLGLTPRQIVLRAKKAGLRTRRIVGRTWVHSDDITKLGRVER